MKSLLAVAILGSLLAHPWFIGGADGKWYEGGSLHRANVGQWRRATYSNKLATAGDWAMTHPRVKAKVMGSGSIENARPYAVDLVRCVDAAAGPSGYAGLGVSQLAAVCTVSLGW